MHHAHYTSGGTTAKSLYECLGQTLANRAGAGRRFIPDNTLLAFHPWGTDAKYVNVDTTTREGILRAKEMGLVPSGKADIIFTSDISFAAEHLFDEENRGRIIGLFRHPIERLVSKFYYLQTARWEKTYSPEWQGMSLHYWAHHINTDNNHMVRRLTGKTFRDEVSEVDLRRAMRTVKQRFVVGLTSEMAESVHRFNNVMGIDETTERNSICMNDFFGGDDGKKNANEHPLVSLC